MMTSSCSNVPRASWPERDHPCSMVTYRDDLASILLDVTITSDDQPPVLRHDGNPLGILAMRGRDGARRALPLVNQGTWVARVCHIGAQRRENLRQAEDVSIQVEAHLSRFDPAHAARCAFSYDKAQRTSATSR